MRGFCLGIYMATQKRYRPDKDGNAKAAFEKAKKIIFARDAICAICGRPVNYDKHFPDPWSATLDHIIPIAKGGDPASLENLQLAHLQCNRVKSSKTGVIVQTKQVITNRDLPLSRDWLKRN